MTPVPPRAHLDPSADLWPGLLHTHHPQSHRAPLGLPTNTPIIMVGHQAVFWHPGVLAKYFAAHAAAKSLHAATAWLIVDHDEHELDSIRVPVRDKSGAIKAEAVPLSAEPLPDRIPACLLPPISPGPLTTRLPAALPSVTDGLARIRESLARHRAAPSAAEQVTRAAIDLLSGLVSPGVVITASSLARTDAFTSLIDVMRRDPLACVRAYNAAAAAHPHARIAPLREESPAGVELPLWWLSPGKPRRRAFSSELASPPAGSSLAPRALLLTALARTELCDLFIHGVGGSLYDPITEQWMSAWLGKPLAPTTLVTADLLLPLGESPIDPADVAQARWRAHRARHDPALLGLTDLAREKTRRIDQIAAARIGGAADPRPLYAAMHAFLESYRQSHAARIERLVSEATALRERAQRAAIATDRTWAFPLHERADLERLREVVSAPFRAAT